MAASDRPRPPAVRAVIFDLDGVLVSSAGVHYEAFRRTFADAGRELSFPEYLRIGIGAARDVLIRRVLGDDLPEERLAELMAAKARHVEECIAEQGLEPVEGARSFVGEARRRGLATAVATASRTPALLLSGAGLDGLFDVVVDRNDVERTKPHPDLYLAAAQRLSVPPESCLVIEDSPAGIGAALAAGMRVIALTTTQPAESLAGAHAIAGGFDEIDLDTWLG